MGENAIVGWENETMEEETKTTEKMELDTGGWKQWK